MEKQHHKTCTRISAGGKVMEADSVTFNVTAVVYQMVWAVAEHYKKLCFLTQVAQLEILQPEWSKWEKPPCVFKWQKADDVYYLFSSRYSCKQCTDSYPNSRTTPKTHTRSRSYTRSLTSSQVTKILFICIKGFYPLFQCFVKVLGFKMCVKLI